VRVRAGDEHRRSRLEVEAELLGTGPDGRAAGEAPLHDVGQELARRLLGGPGRRSYPLDLGADQRGDEAQERRRRVAARGVRAQP